ILPAETRYAGTLVGGVSGIDYDPHRGQYVAISDDRSENGPARYYQLTLDLSKFSRSNSPGAGGVLFTGVTTLQTPTGGVFPAGTVDPESIRLRRTANGTTILWTNEGVRSGSAYQPPTLREMTSGGMHMRDFAVPPAYLPEGSAGANARGDIGIRNNLAFESLTLSLDGNRAYIATENALAQDGPKTSLATGSPSRVAEFSLDSGQRTSEFVYEVEPIGRAPSLPGGSADNGLTELLAVGERRFIALERSYVQGMGNRIRLYLTDASTATDVSGLNALAGAHYTPMAKTLLLDLADLRNDDGSALKLDNVEGITFGPEVDGQRTLLLVSDNNFSGRQLTQFIALTVEGDFVTPR
ncbi:MAG: sorting domain protein, partial [Rhizobacter sp.]|nr:sorting domain protein [Rhizobacter sp.]